MYMGKLMKKGIGVHPGNNYVRRNSVQRYDYSRCEDDKACKDCVQ